MNSPLFNDNLHWSTKSKAAEVILFYLHGDQIIYSWIFAPSLVCVAVFHFLSVGHFPEHSSLSSGHSCYIYLLPLLFITPSELQLKKILNSIWRWNKRSIKVSKNKYTSNIIGRGEEKAFIVRRIRREEVEAERKKGAPGSMILFWGNGCPRLVLQYCCITLIQ